MSDLVAETLAVFAGTGNLVFAWAVASGRLRPAPRPKAKPPEPASAGEGPQ